MKLLKLLSLSLILFCSLPKTTWCLFIVISFSTELNESPLRNDTEQNMHGAHTHTLKESENSIYWCMYKHYTLEYKKYKPIVREGWWKNRTMKRVARTAELIDSADNNKRNDWNQSVPNNTGITHSNKKIERIHWKERTRRWQPKYQWTVQILPHQPIVFNSRFIQVSGRERESETL